MNIKYIVNVRIPTVRAQGYAIMKMCEQFAVSGATVDLIVPNKRNNEAEEDPFVYYKVKKNFSIRKLWATDFLGTRESYNRSLYWADVISFLYSVRFGDVVHKEDVVYTRDFLVVFSIPSPYPVYLELHEIPQSKFLFKKALLRVKKFFVLNENIKKALVDLGVDPQIVFIAPSGVEIDDFSINLTQEDARKELDLPIDKKIIVYTGHLYEWKGVYTLGDAARMVPEVLFLFVGGSEPEFSIFTKKYADCPNIIVRPFQPRSIIPRYIKAADALVVPNSAHSALSAEYTSPLKLFEYMAGERPIVISDLSSMRSVMDESLCFFAKPDNPESFRDAIQSVLEDPVQASSVAQRAREQVGQYSWTERARKIMELL